MAAFTVYSRKTKLKAGALIILATMLVVLGLDFFGVLDAYRLKTLDLMFRHAPLPKADPQVVVATVDQPDLDYLQKQAGITWPWPRHLYAPLIDYCRHSGTKAVIFDILYTEPSSYGPKDDQDLAAAAKTAGNVILPFFLSVEDKPVSPDLERLLDKSAIAVSGSPPPNIMSYQHLLAPIPPLLAAARTLGNVRSHPDKDGIILDLLAAEITATLEKDPGECYRSLEEQFGRTYYARLDAPANTAQKAVLKNLSPEMIAAKTLAGSKILAKLTRAPANNAPIGGLKVVAEQGWFAARPSGTEDIYKIYAESFVSQEHLQRLQTEAQEVISQAFKAAGV
jgi:CHASE2 domain-containing sensor protein